MRGIRIIPVVLALVLVMRPMCTCAVQPGAAAPTKAGKYTGDDFAEEQWTWHNLYYGPLEIVMSPFMLFIGPAACSSGWSNYPSVEKDTKPPSPLAMAGGGVLGVGMGLVMFPAMLLKGVFDTLTGGAFADSGTFYDVKL